MKRLLAKIGLIPLFACSQPAVDDETAQRDEGAAHPDDEAAFKSLCCLAAALP